jgi:hypothetical protein
MTEDKGEWAEVADEGIVPDELSDDDDAGPVGRRAESEEPATEHGVDEHAGDRADAVRDGGPEVPDGVEPDLKDAAATQLQKD